jgi:hypothetical protein
MNMRLWTIHPRYLDAKGLVALWREALLAQKVLAGGTEGYRNHPQLFRFRSHPAPEAAIAVFLRSILEESRRRGYNFNAGKIAGKKTNRRIRETRGQLLYEWKHLRHKLLHRSRSEYLLTNTIRFPESNPLFEIVRGGVRSWERVP